ncbi:unnamed protein product [Rhizophagus irregularis]|nr:unnamed protein product [Rhizophagus irregularis]
MKQEEKLVDQSDLEVSLWSLLWTNSKKAYWNGKGGKILRSCLKILSSHKLGLRTLQVRDRQALVNIVSEK